MVVDVGACFHEGNRVSIIQRFTDSGEPMAQTICEVWPGQGDDLDIHDGRLISSAPAMYEALEDCVQAMDAMGIELQKHRGTLDARALGCQVSGKARGLLTAARGES